MADGDGNVYLHDVRIEQGVQIASEGIVKLSSKGKYISTVASVEAEKGSGKAQHCGNGTHRAWCDLHAKGKGGHSGQ